MLKFNRIITAICCASLATSLAGCSGGGSSVQPAQKSTLDYPLKDRPLTFLNSTSAAVLPAHLLASTAKGLIVKKSTGKTSAKSVNDILEDIMAIVDLGELAYNIYEDVTDPTGHALTDISNGINTIESQIGTLTDSVKKLSTDIKVDFSSMQLAISNTTMQNNITAITNIYNSGLNNSLTYYSNNAALYQQTNGGCVNSTSNPCTSVAVLKDEMVSKFLPNATTLPSGMILAIHDQILPSSGVGNLMLLAQYLVSNGDKTSGQAKNKYLILEAQFSQLLNYQLQALAVLANGMQYTTANNPEFTSYVHGYFIPYINAELKAFMDATDFLVANLYDYRNQTQYAQDLKNKSFGIAPLNTPYFDMLGRSRAFCSIIMNAYATSENPGLAGTIILPQGYTNGQKITLKFTPQSGGTTYTYTITPTLITSSIPYAKWTNTPTSTPPYSVASDTYWLSYDLSFSLLNKNTSIYETVTPAIYSSLSPPSQYTTRPDMPVGTYTVSIVDSGSLSQPWYHDSTATTIGTVNVMYHDPTPGSGISPTLQANTTNTIKFGYFALNWPWSFPISSIPFSEWISSTQSSGKAPTYEDTTRSTYTDNTSYTGTTSLTPFFDQLLLHISVESTSSTSASYKATSPVFKISSSSFDVYYSTTGNSLTTGSGCTDAVTGAYGIYLSDVTGSTPVNTSIETYSATSPKLSDINYNSPATSKIVPYSGTGTTFNILLTSSLSDNYSGWSCGNTRNERSTLNWDIQIVPK